MIVVPILIFQSDGIHIRSGIKINIIEISYLFTIAVKVAVTGVCKNK